MKNGMRITVPLKDKVNLSNKKYSRKINANLKEMKTDLNSEKHLQYLKSLENTDFALNNLSMTYHDAVKHLHGQIHNINLDYDDMNVIHKDDRSNY